MKKHILLAFACFFAALASKAAVGDRFQVGDIYYEVLSESPYTCQTAAANYSIEYAEKIEKVWPEWNNWQETEIIVADYKLTGQLDPDAPQNVNGIVGPNWERNRNKQVIEIPSEVKFSDQVYTVTAVGDFSFAATEGSVNSIKFPETVTKVGKAAFWGYSNMNDLSLKNIETIGEFAFKGCANISNIIIPSSVNSIGDNAFFGCSNTKNIIFEEGQGEVKMGKSVFEGLKALDSVKFSNRNKEIGESAFKDCQSMKTVEFAEGLTKIGKSAFENCSGIGPNLTLPDSLIEIDDSGFKGCTSIHYISFGKNLEKVGKEGFYRVCFREHGMYLPASLTKIGSNAFNFQTNGSNLTDIYYPNSNPVKTEPDAFGYDDDQEYKNYSPDYWIYSTVCLHVPFGTTAKYRELEDWRFFKCIIDDILPEESENDRTHSNPDDALAYIIDYLYIVPGDDIDLNSLLRQNKLIGEDEEDSFKWEPISDIEGSEGYNKEKSDILTLGSDGIGKAKEKAYGNVIALGNRKSSKYNSNSTEVPVYAPLGAVIIFVCPTITVVYDKDNAIETNTPSQPAQARAKAPRRAGEEGSNDNIPSADTLQSENSTYSHPVVFNSLPKVQVNPAPNITISKIERASMDAYNVYIEGEELDKVDKDLMDTGGESGYVGSIVPQEPITENRMLVVTLDLEEGIPTGAEEIEIDDKISVAVSGRNLSVIGADEDAEVLVADLNGRIVYNGTEKALSLEPGVYIIRVEDVAFKAIVR